MSKGEKSLQQSAQKLQDLMLSRGLTLSLAESCTGGLISSSLTSLSGSSGYFMGSIVSYANDVKVKQLAVSPASLRSVGAVSPTVAKQMALGARTFLKSDWSASVTGVAGPGGGSPEKPVGTVCFAVCGPGFEEVEQKLIEGGDRRTIQENSANYLLEFILKSVQS